MARGAEEQGWAETARSEAEVGLDAVGALRAELQMGPARQGGGGGRQGRRGGSALGG